MADAQCMENLQALDAQVSGMCSGSNALGAIRAAFENGVPKTKSDECKALMTSIAGKAIGCVSDSDIGYIIGELSQDEKNTLMKYVFKCMASGENCGSLLKWHSALYDDGGVGILMRALVDRKV